MGFSDLKIPIFSSIKRIYWQICSTPAERKIKKKLSGLPSLPEEVPGLESQEQRPGPHVTLTSRPTWRSRLRAAAWSVTGLRIRYITTTGPTSSEKGEFRPQVQFYNRQPLRSLLSCFREYKRVNDRLRGSGLPVC